jgi:hypothetical protein
MTGFGTSSAGVADAMIKAGRFILEINRDGPVFTGLAGAGSHCHPQVDG